MYIIGISAISEVQMVIIVKLLSNSSNCNSTKLMVIISRRISRAISISVRAGATPDYLLSVIMVLMRFTWAPKSLTRFGFRTPSLQTKNLLNFIWQPLLTLLFALDLMEKCCVQLGIKSLPK